MRRMLRKTRIVATVGPGSSSAEKIKELLLAGVNVFRINFSHGNHQIQSERIETIRKVSDSLGLNPALLADLQGPKIRTGKTDGGRSVTLSSGSEVTITSDDVVCDENLISVDYPHLVEEISVGQRIMINDGLIKLEVDEIDKRTNRIHCVVVDGGVYSSRKGVNLPNVDLSVPSLTEKDREDIGLIVENDFQYVALSFVRRGKDIEKLREIIAPVRPDLKIIAKIEKPEAADNIEEILGVSDGIMVARGDLGVEMSPDVVPVVQKDLIRKANDSGKIVIVATQMLESMINHPLPTRAEAADVANAIIDDTDAVMLSGETAVGSYAVQSVETMSRIAFAAEQSEYCSTEIIDFHNSDRYPPHAMAEAAVWAARDMGGIPICLYTLSGDTAFYMAKLRNQSPVYVFSPDIHVVKMLSIAWNVEAFHLSFSEGDQVRMLRSGEEILVRKGILESGDTIAVLAGTTPVRGATNILRIKKVFEV
ncbi:Pyruvate kinase [Chitinispirillum alkaliphilum]|nr:Pyruvate kinase [Chitinispirillum alkaliphilum]